MKRSQHGFALVSVLAIIIVLTIIIVAFVSQSRLDVASSSSFSNAVAADKLTEDAVATITAGILAEIENGSTIEEFDNGNVLYEPLERTDVAPKKDSFAQGVNTNAPNLLRSSGPHEFFPGAGNQMPMASAVKTDDASGNGRRISAERWNLPQLIPAAAATAVDVPNWIFVNRAGPLPSGATFNPTYGDAFVNGELNPDYIIGRYAYRVYDVSGLVDVNVAGYPAGTPESRVGRKGGLTWANFTNGVEQIADWRWPLASRVGFENYVDTSASVPGSGAGPRSGFLLMPTGLAANPNRFLTRGDLLAFLRSDTADQLGLTTDLAPDLTVFTREASDAPIGIRDTVPAVAAERPLNPPLIASQRITVELNNANQTIPGLRRDGTATDIGDPLVKKFPLSKIALLALPNPSPQQVSDIEAWFGLVKRSDGKWDYIHGMAAAGGLETLKSLETVADEGREPNFFELLQAGILTDSLGQSTNDTNAGGITPPRDLSLARHILQIGANIIDQYDAANNPTVIARSGVDADDPDISGIEGNPLIQIVGKAYYRSRDPSPVSPKNPVGIVVSPNGFQNYPRMVGQLQFQIWNPHHSAGGTAPGEYRIVASGETQVAILKEGGPTFTPPTGYDDRSDKLLLTPDQDIISFEILAGAPQAFATPTLLTTDTATSSKPVHVDGPSKIVGFYCGEAYTPYQGIFGNDVPDNPDQSFRGLYEAKGLRVRITFPEPLTLQLQKRVNSNWLPLQTLTLRGGGNEILNLNHFTAYSDAFHNGPFIGHHYLMVDPRTGRFGPMSAERLPNPTDPSGMVVNTNFPKDRLYIFDAWSSQVTGSLPDTSPSSPPLLTIGNLIDGRDDSAAYYSDRGTSIIRHADDPTENPYVDNLVRPVIVNRPFKSIAELAYASRDQPWKTISFSADNEEADVPPADSVLLDLFTVQPEPSVRSGVINLNTASETALQALLSSTDLSENDDDPPEASLSASESVELAGEIFDYVRDSPDQYLRTPADIALMVKELAAAANYSKRKREAIVVALADAHNARTWNLVLDVIAQTGKITPQATNFSGFQATGESRVLVHLAIDRYTGEIVDKMVESMPE